MKKVIYQNLSKRQGIKHVWLEGPAGHMVKLFNKGDFKRVLLQKMNNWVVVYIYESFKVLSGVQVYRVKLSNKRDFWRVHQMA